MRTLILCLTLTLLNLLPAWSAEILVLQSNHGPGYTQALRGFHAASKKSNRVVMLSDYAEVDVDRLVKEERPRLVVALGDRALAAAGKLREVPVLALLSLALDYRKHGDNVGGISMIPAPEQYLRLFTAMGVKRVGVFYDPSKTGAYLKGFEHDSKRLGLKLAAEPVNGPREIQAKLDRIRERVDVLLVLPDSTVFTTLNMEAFMLFSMDQNVPVVTFSGHHLKKGAACALEIDYYDIGVQAAELAGSMLESRLRKTPTLPPRKTHLKANESVMRKLKMKIAGP